MKEYKTVTTSLGFTKRTQRIEDILNQYAREGWQFKHINEAQTLIVFEREKNR